MNSPSSTGADPRRLVLLRHAKAEHGADLTDEGDLGRTLALAGRRQASQVGASLAAADLRPDLVLCSSSVRTRQTWDLVRTALGGSDAVLQVSDELYSAGVRGMLDVVRTVDPAVRTVLVVGHEPTVSELAAVLAGPGSDEAGTARVRVGMPTGSYAVLGTDAAWSALEPDGARLRSLVTPG